MNHSPTPRLVRIIAGNGADVIDTYAFIELQGSLQSDCGVQSVELGTFKVDENGSATLLIGGHRLGGKRVKLKKPLLVCGSFNSAHDHSGGLDVKGVIREKYLFTTRPRPRRLPHTELAESNS